MRPPCKDLLTLTDVLSHTAIICSRCNLPVDLYLFFAIIGIFLSDDRIVSFRHIRTGHHPYCASLFIRNLCTISGK